MDIDGIKVTVTGDPYPGEIEGYVRRGLREHGKRLTGMVVTLKGADVDIEYILRKPFERIRRITGYLVGTTDRWNNAKRAEEHDRVKHGLANQCVACGNEMPEGDHVCEGCRASRAIYPHGLNVRVTTEQMASIERACIQKDMRISEVVRGALDAWMNDRVDELQSDVPDYLNPHRMVGGVEVGDEQA